mgnify:CR=1 FL=1
MHVWFPGTQQESPHNSTFVKICQLHINGSSINEYNRFINMNQCVVETILFQTVLCFKCTGLCKNHIP